MELRQGLKISAPEEIASRLGLFDAAQLERLAGAMTGARYGSYLLSILDEG